MSKALVSILIPAFQAEPWIRETLVSAFRQTHLPCEVIVVDDGSADETLRVARETQVPAHVHCRIETQPNRGAAAARNHALRLAQGDYIQFLDADDLIAPDKVERQLDALTQAGPDTIAAGPWGRFELDPAEAVFTPEDNWRSMSSLDWLKLNFAGRGMMPPAAWLTPRRLIDAAGPWDESLTLNDDGEYFCRVLLAGSTVRFCESALSFYRSNIQGSLSRDTSSEGWDSAFRSQLSCVARILAVDDTHETKRACADLLIRLAYACYPASPEIAVRAEELSRDYGGSSIEPAGGIAFRTLARCLGWKFARRLQTTLARARKP